MSDKKGYLERLFIDELNSEGEIEIRGSVFNRDMVLSELDSTAYQMAFDDWKSDRYQNRLGLANELLDLHRNSNRFARLKELFQRGSIIPFIGAGLSYPTGFPLWREFLEETQKETTTDINKFNQHIERNEYEEVAQYLEDTSPNIFQEQLEHTFGKRKGFTEIDGVICRLPDFFPSSAIITTNYDSLVKTVYEECGQSFHEYLEGMNAVEFKKLLGENTKVLLKLHGTYTTKSKRILTENDYNRHYDDENTITDCISTLCSRSLLFLGCSLSIDRTIQTMIDIVDSRGADSLPRHYAFLSCENMKDEERKNRTNKLSKANIFPIWYDGDHDECIEALLEKLNDETQ